MARICPFCRAPLTDCPTFCARCRHRVADYNRAEDDVAHFFRVAMASHRPISERHPHIASMWRVVGSALALGRRA